MKLVSIVLTIVLTTVLACVGLLPPSVESRAAKSNTGAWSTPVEGIQGRLTIAEDTSYNGTKMVAVYLELRNVSNVANPIEIYYDPIRSIRCDLLDTNNKPVTSAGLPADILTPTAFWLAVPYDGSVRFKISVAGYGVPKNGGLLVPAGCDDWLIKDGDRGKYSLEATLVSQPTKEDHARRAWHGALKVPKAEIPR